MFLFGFLIGIAIYQPFEWFFINYIYLKNIGLFNDLILTEKSRNKLKIYYGGVK